MQPNANMLLNCLASQLRKCLHVLAGYMYVYISVAWGYFKIDMASIRALCLMMPEVTLTCNPYAEFSLQDLFAVPRMHLCLLKLLVIYSTQYSNWWAMLHSHTPVKQTA